MNELMTELVSLIDRRESQRPNGYDWKPDFDRIISDIAATDASADSEQVNSSNPLFRHLAKQNEILMALVMLTLIAGQGK